MYRRTIWKSRIEIGAERRGRRIDRTFGVFISTTDRRPQMTLCRGGANRRFIGCASHSGARKGRTARMGAREDSGVLEQRSGKGPTR